MMQPMITLLGLGADAVTAPAPSSTLTKEIDGFLLQSPKPTSSDVTSFLKLYSGDARTLAAQALVERGVSPITISSALTFLNTSGALSKGSIWGMLSLASMAACTYHGIKRNNGSIGWGLWWGLMGTIFPVVAPIVAIARKPGFAKPLEK